MKGLLSIRFFFACMAFLGLSCALMMRFNISVAMTIMAGSGHHNTSSINTSTQFLVSVSYDNTYMEGQHGYSAEVADNKDYEETEFDWNSHTQELLLAAFYIGYTLGNIPAGWVSDKLGGKWVIFGGVFGSAVWNIVGPLAARSSVEIFFVTRCFAGFSEGFVIPAISTMVNNWSPVNERTRMMTFIIAGLAFGPAVGQSLSGIICAKLGWPATFYIFGGLNLTWACIWAVTSYEKPARHPFISKKERMYIEMSRSQQPENITVPIRSILLSLPVISFTLVLFGIAGFVYFNLACNLPLYFKHVLDFDILSVGYLTSVPYVCQWLASLLTSFLADLLIGRNVLSRTMVRKLTIVSGAVMMATCFLVISFGVENNTAAIVVLMAVMYGAMGVVFSAVFVNALDIAPSYSGTVAGIGNGIAVTSGFIAPLVSAVFIEDQSNPAGWRIVFIITVAVVLLCAGFFFLFGSGDVQPWAMVEANKNKVEKSEETAAMMSDITPSHV